MVVWRGVWKVAQWAAWLVGTKEHRSVVMMAVKKVERLVEQRVDMMVGSMVEHSVEWKVVTSVALMVEKTVAR